MRPHLIVSVLVVWIVLLWAAADSAPAPNAVINVTQTQTRHMGFRQATGDDEFWLYQLYNRRITQASIGYSTLRCEFYGRGGPLGSGVSDCAAIYSLAKGKIIARGVVKSRDFYALAIIGGTGIYSNSTGQVLALTIGSRPHEERLLFAIDI